jgi:polysaccharide pyruvyl transferase WcaK-like protein
MFVKQKVQRINYISVRETSGKRILQELDINNVTQVLDPVFLLESSFWEQRFVKIFSEKYLFIYDFETNPIIEKLAKEISKKLGLKIFTINKNISYADKNFYNKGPEIFLSLISSATFVISNSFHAVAFSLIFNKQFLVVNRSEKINTRMRDLLDLFNLSELLVSDNFDSTTIQTINYEKVNLLQNEAIKKSKFFLNNALTK